MAGKKILVADDSLTIQKVIKLALSNEGYEIKTVSDGDEAVQEIALFRPDLVLVDISLPGKTGFEVKQAINEVEQHHHTRFILMSSAFERIDEEKEAAVDFHGRLIKPFDPAHLRQLITDVLKTAPEPLHPIPQRPHFSASTPSIPTQPIVLAQPSPPVQETLSHQSISTSESDIKELTESTMKLAEGDDLGWSVSNVPSFGESTGEIQSTVESHRMDFEPTLEPYKTILNDQESSSYFTFPDSIPEPASSLEEIAPVRSVFSSDAPPQESTKSQSSTAVPLSASQMEDLVKTQLQPTLEAMARKMLPDLAERILKQEIRRMLEEQR